MNQNEAHLWYVLEEELQDQALLQRYEALLTPEEAIRWRRFYFPADRHRFLVTRALLRTTLSRYAPVKPADWRFVENKYGRPSIADPAYEGLRFNLSHTKGMIACLVSHQREVGVDVESLDRKGDLVGIADNFFAPAEVAALRALPAHAQRVRFLTYWTLKESYIKARGMGLSLPLDKFAFSVDGAIQISIDPSLNDSPSRWRFSLHNLGGHLVAAALERVPEEPALTLSQTIPLSETL